MRLINPAEEKPIPHGIGWGRKTEDITDSVKSEDSFFSEGSYI